MKNMKTMKIAMLGIVAMAAVAGWADDVVVRDGEREWRFAEVNGTSRLPFEYMRTGKNEQKLEDVKFPRFWIARTMVTEDDFAAFFGHKVHASRKGADPVTEIEWDEARAFSEWFTRKYHSQFPTNCIASLPSMMEWAHAVRVLENKVDLCSDVGTFLFTGSAGGGYLYTTPRQFHKVADSNLSENEWLAWRFVVALKRMRSERIGLRLVLVDAALTFDGDNQTLLRGRLLLRAGELEEAKRYCRLALKQGRLSADDQKSAKKILSYEEKPYAFEDWSGLVALSAKTAAKRGYETEPFCGAWQWLGLKEPANASLAEAYRKRGVVGEWKRIGDLPKEIQRDQRNVGEDHVVLLMKDEDMSESKFKVGTNTLVQVLKCDFTGDGRADMVVEQFDAVGSAGYRYNFYSQLPNGSYTNVHELQTVGLCALPKKNGKCCGFLTVDKIENPVLSTRLLEYKDGKMIGTEAHARPFYMLDAQGDQLYLSAPFIGAGYGLGWRVLEGRGIWYRPLFWPWKAGTVRLE